MQPTMRTDGGVCESDVHAALKAIPGWYESLPLLGFTDLGDGELLEQRNCGCGSTLVRIVKAEDVVLGGLKTVG